MRGIWVNQKPWSFFCGVGVEGVIYGYQWGWVRVIYGCQCLLWNRWIFWDQYFVWNAKVDTGPMFPFFYAAEVNAHCLIVFWCHNSKLYVLTREWVWVKKNVWKLTHWTWHEEIEMNLENVETLCSSPLQIACWQTNPPNDFLTYSY